MNLSEIDFRPYTGFCDFIPTPLFATLMNIRNKFVICVSGNRGGKCVTKQTLIDTPRGEISIGELYEAGKPFEVYSWDGNKKIVAQASAPFKKDGLHQCHRIEMTDGRYIEAADYHKILTGLGYISVSDLYSFLGESRQKGSSRGELPQSYFLPLQKESYSCLPQKYFSSLAWSILEFCPSVRVLDEKSFWEKALDYQENYSGCCDFYGGPPRPFRDNGLIFFPLSDGVLIHTVGLSLCLDGLGNRCANILFLKLFHLSNRGVLRRTLVQFFEFLDHTLRTSVQWMIDGIQESLRPLFGLGFGLRSFHEVGQCKDDVGVSALLSPFCIDGNYLKSITPILGKQEVFDMEVEKYHNYFSGGLIHHNTNIITRKIIYELRNMSPIQGHNIHPEDKCRTLRLSAALLPQDKDNEHQCTLYINLKKQIPLDMIIGDITYRRPVLTVRPTVNDYPAGKPALLEFVSYGQETINKAGVERRKIIWDEPGPYSDYEEDVPRIATVPDAQFIAGFTPVEADWMYEELYQKARMVIRTPTVRAFMEKELGTKVPQVQRTDSRQDICALQWATDDNPIFKVIVEQEQKRVKDGIIKKEDFPYENVKEYLDSTFIFDDIPTIAMRRYGIFTRITGAIHKQYHWDIHRIDERRWFPNDVPIESGIHVRLIDYHQNVPWACLWLWLSPENECFAYQEFNPDPKDWTTLGIAKEMVMRSHQGGGDGGGEYRYKFNLIDALAAENQTNTNTSVVKDLNTHFSGMKRSGFGTGGYWETWNTHGKEGRDRVKERLKNSLVCGRPFNNLQMQDVKMVRLPTLWVFSKCHQTNLSLKNWRQETWASKDDEMIKDQKDKAEQKWSHFNMCLEAAMKDVRFRGHNYEYHSSREEHEPRRYFQGARI